jgi:hypothetical protein
MNKSIVLAALLATAAPLTAQVAIQGQTSESNSGAEANSGSISGAQSNNTANNNAGIGVSNNTNTTNSNAGAVSGSASEATSSGNTQGQSANNTQGQGQDQGQGQQQSANNTQGQGQDQGQGQTQSNDANNSNANAAEQGQMQDQEQTASNANTQGVTFNQTTNSRTRRVNEHRTNNAVPLAASSSFSSDYCGGTVSGGGSSAPLGISIGVSGTRYDKSCQSLRRAEKFGMAAVNASNMGQLDLSGRLMSMMIWSICTSDSGGPDRGRSTADACDKLLLLGSVGSTRTAQPAPAHAPEPAIVRHSKVTPEAVTRARTVQEQQIAAATPPRQ